MKSGFLLAVVWCVALILCVHADANNPRHDIFGPPQAESPQAEVNCDIFGLSQGQCENGVCPEVSPSSASSVLVSPVAVVSSVETVTQYAVRQDPYVYTYSEPVVYVREFRPLRTVANRFRDRRVGFLQWRINRLCSQ